MKVSTVKLSQFQVGIPNWAENNAMVLSHNPSGEVLASVCEELERAVGKIEKLERSFQLNHITCKAKNLKRTFQLLDFSNYTYVFSNYTYSNYTYALAFQKYMTLNYQLIVSLFCYNCIPRLCQCRAKVVLICAL